MHDRGMIKWLPFDAVMNSKEIINDILENKNKINMPLLSNDQIEDLEYKIINALHCQKVITIYYYENGKIKVFKDIIKKIDSINHKIYLTTNILLFNYIINIED